MTSCSSHKPFFHRLNSASSSSCMPNLRPVWIDELIRYVLFSRIRLAMAGVTTSISYAATNPLACAATEPGSGCR